MTTTEGTMYQDVLTKEDTVAIMQSEIVAAIGYLSMLQVSAEKNNALDCFPVFKDPTVQSAIAKYRDLQSVRGW